MFCPWNPLTYACWLTWIVWGSGSDGTASTGHLFVMACRDGRTDIRWFWVCLVYGDETCTKVLHMTLFQPPIIIVLLYYWFTLYIRWRYVNRNTGPPKIIDDIHNYDDTYLEHGTSVQCHVLLYTVSRDNVSFHLFHRHKESTGWLLELHGLSTGWLWLNSGQAADIGHVFDINNRRVWQIFHGSSAVGRQRNGLKWALKVSIISSLECTGSSDNNFLKRGKDLLANQQPTF